MTKFLCQCDGNGLFFDAVPLVAGTWSETRRMYHGGSFFKLADDNMDIQNSESEEKTLFQLKK